MAAGYILLDSATFLALLKSHLADGPLQVRLAIFVQARFIQQPISVVLTAQSSQGLQLEFDGKYLMCRDPVFDVLCVFYSS